MKSKGKAVWLFIAAAGNVVLAIIFLSVASGGKEQYKYAWDEEYKNAVDMCSLIGWVFVVLAGVNLIEGIVHGLGAALYPEESERDTQEQRISGTVRCASCNCLMSGNATRCIRCGTPVAKQISDTSAVTINADTEAMVKPTRNCLFCGASMAEDQTFCGTCGRRQD